jgi:site-specific DNA recombinase
MVLEQARSQADGNSAEFITKAEVDSALESFTPLWDTLNLREQERVLHLLIQRVDYDGANGKIAVTFNANGIKTLGCKPIAASTARIPAHIVREVVPV